MTGLCPQLLLQEANNLLLDSPSLKQPDRVIQNIPGINKVTPHHAPSSPRKFLYFAEIKQNFCVDLLDRYASSLQPHPASPLKPHGLKQARPCCALAFLPKKPNTRHLASSGKDLVQLSISPKLLDQHTMASVCDYYGFPLWLLWDLSSLLSSREPLSSSGSRITCL